jgi:hypothetical protein
MTRLESSPKTLNNNSSRSRRHSRRLIGGIRAVRFTVASSSVSCAEAESANGSEVRKRRLIQRQGHKRTEALFCFVLVSKSEPKGNLPKRSFSFSFQNFRMTRQNYFRRAALKNDGSLFSPAKHSVHHPPSHRRGAGRRHTHTPPQQHNPLFAGTGVVV